jgi:hypothetical protein
MGNLQYFTLTGNLSAVVIDYTDPGAVPDKQNISCTVDIIPRIPIGQLLWASGLSPKQGLALSTFRARCDTDGYLRTIAAGGATNETQSITVTGSPSGTFPLTWQGQTATIPFGSTSSAVENLFAALPNVGVGNVNVGGATGGPWQVTFTGAFAGTDVPTMSTTHPNVTIGPVRTGSLNSGVQLVANTVDLNLDELIYDLVFSQVVYARKDQVIQPMAFVAPTAGGTTLDMADISWIPPKPGIG